MKRFLLSISQSLHDSVLVRLGLAMGILALLSFASIVISTVIAENISGQASAINVSGSLRMMSFRTLSEIQQVEKRHLALDTIEQFERRLHGLDRFILTKAAGNSVSAEAIRVVTERWTEHIRPLARAAIEGQSDAQIQMAQDIPAFVAQIDQVVRLIEEDLEQKIRWLRATQFVLLAIIILVSLITTWMLRQQLVQPLAQLLKAAKSVSQGSFTVRVQHVSSDELGQLGRAFNSMVAEIANMYAHLEDKVDEKTRELTRSNQSFELLYRTSQQLSASDLTLDKVQAVLHDIEEALELGHSMICISENGQLPAHPVIGNFSTAEQHAWCGQQDCGQCFARAELSLNSQAESQPVIVVPIGSSGVGGSDNLRGTLPIFLKNDTPLPREKARIIETVGHHVSNALANMRRAEEKHRLAVLEERSVIARELHDSIAQSLSYLKIQVARLELSIDQGRDARAIADELKSGLNAAYRELRELITTFRLRIDERGFNAALQETISEFSEKLGFPVQLSNNLSGIALSANEEMHVIRIIREGLSNIERHADASTARVDIAVDAEHTVCVRISDDGRGFDPAQTPTDHFGTSIMRDRSLILKGTLDIQSTPSIGTTITLCFLPQKYSHATQ
ncbi:HAMP domain-containing protein [Azonexus sp.]|uniref:HAMP domain-containing protein n=1 Tax=Azonexus sp. TaxID=1872668 RepID=UPI0027BA0E87|nr:HAMP domain-containing protein [Azonexus sp.]